MGSLAPASAGVGQQRLLYPTDALGEEWMTPGLAVYFTTDLLPRTSEKGSRGNPG